MGPTCLSLAARRCFTKVGASLTLIGALGVAEPVNAQCLLPSPGLVSWWSADGAPEDIFGGNPGVLSASGVTYAPGIVGQAFSFDGTNGFVQLPDNLFP